MQAGKNAVPSVQDFPGVPELWLTTDLQQHGKK